MNFTNLNREFLLTSDAPFVDRCLATVPGGLMLSVTNDNTQKDYKDEFGNTTYPAGLLVFKNDDGGYAAVITAEGKQSYLKDNEFVGITVNSVTFKENQARSSVSVMTIGQVNANILEVEIANGKNVKETYHGVVFRNCNDVDSWNE